MSEGKKVDSKTVIIAAVVAALIAVAGFMIYQEQQKETVSINIGGKEISATFER